MRVCCPYCEQWLVDEGFGMMETLWMHEYECSAILLAHELALDGEADESEVQTQPEMQPATPLAA